jgi:hypothetical protein
MFVNAFFGTKINMRDQEACASYGCVVSTVVASFFVCVVKSILY